MKLKSLLIGSLAVLSLVVSGCGSDPEIVEVAGDPHATILSFSVTPGTVEAGGEVTAQWATEHATGIEMTRNGTPVDLGDASVAEGSITLTVDESTVFVLKATGKTDVEPTMSASVSVKADPRPFIVSFTANPSTVQAGETTTLEWQTKDTDTVRIVDGTGAELDLGDAVPAEGSVTTGPLAATTTFKLIAERAGQPSSEKTITVNVPAIESPRIVSFEVDQPVVEEGGAAILTWVTENAEMLQLFEGQEPIDLSGQGIAFGSVKVFPTGASTFRLVASKGDEQDERSLLVRVSGFPVATLEVSPAAIDIGGEATLSWTSTDAETVTIADLEGRPLEGGPVELEGSRTISPSISTTYVLTAVGATGNETRVTAVAGVNPAIVTFDFVDDEEAGVGDLKALKWTTAAATVVEISNLDGDTRTFVGAEAVEGTASIAVGSEGRFELIAKSGRLSARQEISLPLMDAPAIGSFGADREVVSLVEGEAMVRLSWSGVNRADGVELVDSNKGPVDLGSKSTVADFIDVAIEADTTFTLTAQNSSGTATAEVFVRAVPLPSVDSVAVWPDYVGPGETVDLTWTTSGATNVVIEANGVPVVGVFDLSGTATLDVFIPTTFTVKAFNDALDVDSADAIVSVGAPHIDSFESSHQSAWEDTAITLSWEVRGAVSLTLSSQTGVLHSTADRTEVREGTFTTAPLAAGTYDFTLVVETAAGGVKSANLRVWVGSGPTIDSFIVNPSSLLSGTDVTISWSAGPDPDGVMPTLELTANIGSDYTLPGDTTGSATFTLTTLGVYDFTLSATTPNSAAPTTMTRTTTVYGVPLVALEADPQIFDDELHTGVDLSWTSENADLSLEIFTVDGAGVTTPLYQVPAAARDAGTFTAPFQTEATTYRIVARNGLGMVAQDEVTVPMQGTQVLTFDATPVVSYPNPPAPPAIAVLEGDEVELTWTTKRATEVEIDIFASLTIGPGSPYVDITTMGATPAPLDLMPGWTTVGDEEYADITFPAGFTFPFRGADQTAIRVFSNGVASFDLAPLPISFNSYSNVALSPTQSAPFAHICPFWDDLYNARDVVSWLHSTDPVSNEQSLTIQWKGPTFSGGAGNLNFQVVLYESGEIELRYGLMDGGTSGARADGNSATIGVNAGGDYIAQVAPVNTAVPGGLSNRSFRFSYPPSLPLSGSTNWAPLGGSSVVTRTATLTASGMGSESRTVEVEVHPRAAVSLDVVLPAGQTDPIRNQPFTLSWTSQNADALRIEDSSGTVVCTAAPDQVAAGTCLVTETTTGSKTYTAIATGALGHEASTDVTKSVTSADFNIISFDASSDLVDFGMPVTLSWETGDADILTITANGQPLALPPTIDLTSDSFTVPSLTEETTFVLTIENLTSAATKTATLVVVVRTVDLLVNQSATDVPPGAPVTISWNTTSLSGADVKVEILNMPMVEDTSGTLPFTDISTMPDVVALSPSSTDTGSVTHDFINGFTFPFDGADRTRAIVKVDGFISFATSSSSSTSNYALPRSASSDVHLAPFWDDLHVRNGTLYAGPVGTDYIISWQNWSHYYPTSGTPMDLNFQIVLHPDGSFEYRYGTMAPPPAGTTSTSCYPNTCVNEANAASATIGYQLTDGSAGHTLHFGGTSNSSSNTPFPAPGIANRTFVFPGPLAPVGDITINPRATSDLEVCATVGAYTECQTVTVTADFLINEFSASAAAIDRGEDVVLQWDVKNADALELKAGSTVIATELDVDPATGTLTVSPAETTTYTLSVTNDFLGKTLTESRTVTVKQFDLGLTASTDTANPGDPITLTWTATTFSGDPTVLVTPLEEVSGTSVYADISLVAGAELIGSGVDTTMVDLPFANGFEFPFFGATYDTVRISTDGFVTFDTGASTVSTNTALPSTTNARVHLAPFWDNLHTRDSGRVYAAQVGADYVIQWTNMSMTTGSRAASGVDPAEEHNLNFQVVLHADGTFEYRYGMMLGLPGGVTNTACYPNTCENEANGSAATIGYQVPGGGAGYQLYFGGGSPGAGNFPYGGGLSNRSFKFGAYSGSGSMVVTPYDTASYKLCAVSGTFLECTNPVVVTANWKIVSFDAPFAVPLGSPVALSWVTQGGGTIELKATQGGTTTFLPVSTLDPAGDSYSDTLLGDTDYTLELHSFGRVKSISKTVLEQMVSVSLTSSHVEALPGEDVTLTWDVVSLTGGTPTIESNFLGVLVEGSTPFEDIVISGGTQVIGPGITSGDDATAYQDLIFDPAFTFPYFGTDYTQVRIGMQGFLSFDPTITGDNFSNKELPYSTGEMGKIALAAYWGDLQTRATTSAPAGGVYWKYEPAPASGPPYYVIQYDHMMAWQNPTLDATFQVVLFADGAFEYRYGTMLPHADNSAGYMARGGAKTIGYQVPGTSIGSTLHYAPWGSSATAAQVFPGGLEGRTFRYDGPAPLSGSKVVNPTTTTTYTLCGQEGTYQECHEITVVIPIPGDVAITEVMPGDPADQWFEVRNVKPEAVDLEGWTIVGETGSHVITGPLVIPAFGYATFAASANPGFVPTYVYGTDVDLGTEIAGRAALDAGSLTISEVEWDGTWGLVSGSHLSLDGAFHKRGVVASPQEGWCDDVAPSPGASGSGCVSDDYDLERFANVPFQDIRASGTTESAMAADSGRVGVNLPFAMPIFDSTATQVWVDANGWISFAAAQPSTSHFPPSSLPRGATVNPAGPLLAGFWDDLGCLQNNGLPWDFQHQSLTVGGMEMMVLQWNNYNRCSNAGGTTFQIQLWENGDMAVVFDLISAAPGSAAWDVYNGKSAWIGLEGPDRTKPITALYKQIEPLEGRSILFMRK